MAGISRRLAWALAAATVTAGSCGGSSDDADVTVTVPTTAQADVARVVEQAWDDERGPGVVTIRPVITCETDATADETAGETILGRVDGDERCVVGPPAGSGEVFERGSAVVGLDETTGAWFVDVELRAAGAVVWTAVAQQCARTDATCPSGRLAIVLDETIQSAPAVSTPDVAGTVRIADGLGEDDARLLASALNRSVERGDETAAADESTADSADAPADDDTAPTVTTTVPADTASPTTATDVSDEPPVGFLLPAMCGLPTAEWVSDEHPSTQEAGPWATGTRIDGDLDGDGVDEIVWATVCGAGTVASGRGVHVFDADHQPVATLPVEGIVSEIYPDRTVHPIEPRIVNGDVELEVWVWQSADASCCPSVSFDMTFTWDGDRFVATSEIPDPGTAQPPSGEAPVVAWDGQYRPKTSPGRVVQLGHFGRQVELLQEALDQRGYTVDVDGYFGNGTEAAVRQFQRDRGLPVTGVATEDVWDQFGE